MHSIRVSIFEQLSHNYQDWITAEFFKIHVAAMCKQLPGGHVIVVFPLEGYVCLIVWDRGDFMSGLG